jgi:hypothetical protein
LARYAAFQGGSKETFPAGETWPGALRVAKYFNIVDNL